MLLQVTDYILEAQNSKGTEETIGWGDVTEASLKPAASPHLVPVRLGVIKRILADRGFRGPVAVGASPVPSALAPQS